MKKTLFYIILAISPFFVFAQSNKTFWGSFELGYGWGIKDNGNSANFSNNNIYGRMALFQAKIKAGYYLTPQFSLGIGLGQSGYHNPSYNALPIFVDFRYHFTKSVSNLYAFADIGGSFLSDAFTKGYISDMGVAYKIILGKRTSLNPSLAYNLFIYSDSWGDSKENRNRHTILIQLGFEF